MKMVDFGKEGEKKWKKMNEGQRANES
jgi:hypothetical protein